MAKYTKKSYLILFVIIVLVVGQSVYSELHSSKKEEVVQRVYNGKYKRKLEEKYPSYFDDIKIAREEINKSIKSHKIYKNPERKNYIITDYFDEKGRLVFSSEEYNETEKRAETIGKSKDFYYKKYTPDEKGFIYDKDGRVVKRIIGYGGMPYKAETKDSKVTFLKNYYTGVSVIKIRYLEDGTREEEKESMGVITQNYKKTISKYKDDVLINEKILFDSEGDDGFIIATVEKKYNEKGELIYKTVERKDKTNDYKSFTEMDFAKDEIVTKYYKGKDVFATVTENLVGPVETIEETEMDRGKEIKKTYKNKVKAIVKRQKIGEPVKIVDVIEYVPKEKFDYEKYSIYFKLNNTRYFYDKNNHLLFKISFHRNHLPYLDLGVIDKDEEYYNYESYYTTENNDFYTCDATITGLSEVVETVDDKLKIKEYEFPIGQYEKNKNEYKKIYKAINSGDTSFLKDIKLDFKEKMVDKKNYENLIR
ncbi:MAG: hypothetical protein JW924_01725 [Fusobacteriaceae bacterium]|nr:hypothetical protein [Fusobacteriaceae bacterium]